MAQPFVVRVTASMATVLTIRGLARRHTQETGEHWLPAMRIISDAHH
jgi:hypothetical protein